MTGIGTGTGTGIGRRSGSWLIGLLAALGPIGQATAGHGEDFGGPRPSPQAPVPVPGALAVRSLDDLVRLGPVSLERLYRASPPAPIPTGKVKGRPIVLPGSALAVPASRAGRVLWQGKIFDPTAGTAVNRFFGLPMIRGELSHGRSWLDGRPALILDYQRTSLVYARYRDELREVAPGLMLGLMFDRSGPEPEPAMFFALAHGPAAR